MSQLETEIKTIVRNMIASEPYMIPMIAMLETKVGALERELERFKKGCVCMKMCSPPDKEAEFTG